MRLPRIDQADLNLFEFDYDLTFMVFFVDANEKVYGRYGGRDAKDADNRQSLEGLKYTMQAVLAMHNEEKKEFAPLTGDKPKYLRDVVGSSGGKCLHCHQVKEALNRKLVATDEWERGYVWRFPLPENLGVRLEVNRGNVVERVEADSPAAKAGLKAGDVLRRLGNVPVHSFADAQFALDKAPGKGKIAVAWTRAKTEMSADIELAAEWKRSDIRWRPSMHRLVPTLPLSGDDLSATEKKALGLPEKRLAYKLGERVHSRAKAAGIEPGDVILGLEGKQQDLTALDFLDYVHGNYLIGDEIKLVIARGGKKQTIPYTLTGR